MAGRPTKFSYERQVKIVNALKAGNTRTDSVSYAGISYQTFSRWMERGKSGESPFDEFAQSVMEAEAHAAVRNVAIIQKAAEKSWQAAAWWLERRRRDDWAQHVNVNGVSPVDIRVDLVVDATNAIKGTKQAQLSDGVIQLPVIDVEVVNGESEGEAAQGPVAVLDE